MYLKIIDTSCHKWIHSSFTATGGLKRVNPYSNNSAFRPDSVRRHSGEDKGLEHIFQ